MVDLTTDATLLQALRIAATKKISAEDIERQRVSFIKSAIKNRESITEVQIKRVLAEQGGVTKA